MMYIKEIEHHYRVVDMMITFHASERDRYNNSALSLDIFILALSVVLCASVLIDPEILVIIGIRQGITRIILGFASMIIFFLSILRLLIKHKVKASKHASSMKSLIDLKGKCREVLKSDSETNVEEIAILCKTCTTTLSELTPIKDSRFVKLKSQHYRKKEFSKYLDKYANRPFWINSFMFNINAIRKSKHD